MSCKIPLLQNNQYDTATTDTPEGDNQFWKTLTKAATQVRNVGKRRFKTITVEWGLRYASAVESPQERICLTENTD